MSLPDGVAAAGSAGMSKRFAAATRASSSRASSSGRLSVSTVQPRRIAGAAIPPVRSNWIRTGKLRSGHGLDGLGQLLGDPLELLLERGPVRLGLGAPSPGSLAGLGRAPGDVDPDLGP